MHFFHKVTLVAGTVVAMGAAAVAGNGPTGLPPSGITLAMNEANGTGRVTLPDGRAAVQFAASAPKDSQVEWKLIPAMAPGWYTVELGFGPEKNTRKLVDLEWQDAKGMPVLLLDAYDMPSRAGNRPTTILGVCLTRPAAAVCWRKNQERAVASAPLVLLNIKPGRPQAAIAFMEAVEAPLVSGKLLLPDGLGGGFFRAVSAQPTALKWTQADGKSLSTPAALRTSVFLDAALSGITLESSVKHGAGAGPLIHLEHLVEQKSPIPAGATDHPFIPLTDSGRQQVTIEVQGTGLDSHAVGMADFPGGARMAAVQSWDDGIASDKRAAELLQKHGWRASFFFNQHSVMVDRWKELEDLGMEVGSHSWSHPFYALQTPRRCQDESVGMRLLLEGKTGHPVISFAYPFGYTAAYDAQGDYVLRAQQEAGYLACRSTAAGTLRLDDLGNPLILKISGHFLRDRARLDAVWKQAAGATRGVFYIWGHSYEIVTPADWVAFEELLKKFGRKPEAWYASQGDLLVWKWLRDHVKFAATGDANHVTIQVSRERLHPWWAARVPVAIQIPGQVMQATLDGKPLPVVNGQIQLDWRE